MEKLNTWTLRVVSVGSVFIFAGTGIPDFSRLQAQGIDDKQRQQIVHNTVAFAPELGRYFDTELRLEQALVEAAMAEIAAHPAGYGTAQAQGGLAKMGAGLKQTLTGVLTT